MKKRVLYQTLEDRGNNTMVEANGPGYCSDKKAWLCEGYYFWEAGIETAKWWGTRTYANSQRQKGYIVCQTSYDYGAENFFDLAGDSSHRQDFWDSVREVEKAFPGQSLTVAFVLAFMREDDEFTAQFKAVRAYPTLSRGGLKRIVFEEGNIAYIEEDPPIQLCVWGDYKTFLTDPFKVVGNYPYYRKWISINR